MSPAFRSGMVALVGPPNAGKSTLLNALLGQKLAIVAPKPQTTRRVMRGVLELPDAQAVLVESPVMANIFKETLVVWDEKIVVEKSGAVEACSR